jgi:hypothetical protein
MRFADFFDPAPRITLRDPLAQFLGAAEDGIIEYRRTGVVKLPGHSCPTVASAYLMTRAALAALHPDSMPESQAQSRSPTGFPATPGVFLSDARFADGIPPADVEPLFDQNDV